MDAALGHLVFSMKYDVIGDQEHLRLMLRYSFLLSLSLTCFLHHLWFYSPEFSFIITALDFTPLLLHHLPLSHFVFSYFCFSLIFCLHCLFLHRICNSPNNSPYLFSLHVLTVSKIHLLSTEYFFTCLTGYIFFLFKNNFKSRENVTEQGSILSSPNTVSGSHRLPQLCILKCNRQ